MARTTRGLYKRGNIWWMTYRDALGKQRFESCKTARKEDAEPQLRCRKTEADEGTLPPPKLAPTALESLAKRYLTWATNQAGVRTKRYHFAHLIRHMGNIPINAISVEKLEHYRESRRMEKVGPATINREMATLKHALTKAVSWKLIRDSVRRDLADVKKFEEPDGRVRYLESHDEAERLIKECRGMLRPIVITALHTGMRKGEVLGLTWGEVNLRRGLITLPGQRTKNSKSRSIPLNETITATLREVRTRIDVPWVFHDLDGNRLRDIRHPFNTAVRRADLGDFHFHDLRHTFASWLVMAGVDIPTVKELMGHKTLSMTLRYAHLSPKHTAAAVRVLDGTPEPPLDSYLTKRGVEGRNRPLHNEGITKERCA